MMDRRKLTKSERLEIFNKTNGHCAYCGCELTLHLDNNKPIMHVDHVNALRRGGEDEMSNMLPACRSCNHWKSSYTLEGFRKEIGNSVRQLNKYYVLFKGAVRFNQVQETPCKVVFYFERCD